MLNLVESLTQSWLYNPFDLVSQLAFISVKKSLKKEFCSIWYSVKADDHVIVGILIKFFCGERFFRFQT